MIMKRVLLQKLRPKLLDWCPENYKSLCENCWNQDPEKRFNFDQVLSSLNEIINLNLDLTPIIPENRKIEVRFDLDEEVTEVKPPPKFEKVAPSVNYFKIRNNLYKVFKSFLKCQHVDGHWEPTDEFYACFDKIEKSQIPAKPENMDDTIYATELARLTLQLIIHHLKVESQAINDVTITNIVGKGQYESHNEELKINYVLNLEDVLVNIYLKNDTHRPCLQWEQRSLEYINTKIDLYTPHENLFKKWKKELANIYSSKWHLLR